MFVMAKKIKKLFAFTLDGIPISVRCVSSMIVVLNAKCALLLAKKTVPQCRVLLVETH